MVNQLYMYFKLTLLTAEIPSFEKRLKDWRASVSQRGDLTKLVSFIFFKQKENKSRRKNYIYWKRATYHLHKKISQRKLAIQLGQIWILTTWRFYDVASCDVPSSGTFGRRFWCCHVSPLLLPFAEKIPSSDPRLPVKQDMLFSFLFFTCDECWS